MKIVAKYSFNNGEAVVKNQYATEFAQIQLVINAIDASIYRTKENTEKTMIGRMLFSPMEINKAFKSEFAKPGNGEWSNYRVSCNYEYGDYMEGYIKSQLVLGKAKPFREMDFVKPDRKLGIEVQFGKYAFMVYNVCAKMTIFSKMGVIDTGVEIVPTKNFADEMSTGVSYFEQFAWDLAKRGTSNIDIPVFILGIDA